MKKSVLASIAFCLMAVTGFAQQIPFQGKLLENGSPVNGPKDFTFSIDVDGNIWTEDHLGVSVSDGLYSVVLGSITPLPDDLFKSVDSRSMDISIGGTPISPIDVFAPSTSYYFSHNDGAVSRPAILAELSGNVTGWAAIEGVSTVEGNAYGVYGFAGTTVDGESAGVYGYGQGVGKTNMGVFGIGRGLGNGDDFNAPGGGSYNNGVVGWASNNTFGNSGVFGLAHGTKGVDNLGVVGWSEVMNGSENKGVLGWAKGDGINKGVVGMATGGTENWAGWFDGDVMISGSLVSSGANPLQVNNGAGDLRAEMGLFNDGGSIKAYGSGGLNAAILGTRASNDAQGFLGLYNTAGVAGINMKVEGGPGTEYGSLLTMGPNTPNIQLLGKNWDDPDLPAIYLFGQHTNGSTWYKTNVLLEVHSDGTNNWGKLTLENGIEGASPQEPTVQLDGFDGSLTLRSPDGSQEFRIDPSGLGASSTSFPNLEIETGFTDPGTPGITMGVTQDTGGNDPTGYSGWIGVNGKNGPNITLSANSFENHDLPSFNMAGSIVHPTEGWTYSSLDMWVERDNGTGEEAAKFHMMGNEGISNIEMGGKLWEPGGGGLPYMAMRGIQGPDLVWMEAVDDGAGNEFGSINFMSTDGASFGINAYGLQTGELVIRNDGTAFDPVKLIDGEATGIGAGAIELWNNGGSLGIYMDGWGTLNTEGELVAGDPLDNAVHTNYNSINIITAGSGLDDGFNAASLNAGANGPDFFGSMSLNSTSSEGIINMGFAGPNSAEGFYSLGINAGAGQQEFALMNIASGGPGGAVFGSLNLNDDLGNSVSINGYGDIGVSGTLDAGALIHSAGNIQSGDFDGATGSGVMLFNYGDIDLSQNLNAAGSVNAGGNVQSGDFGGGTGVMLFNYGDIDLSQNLNAGGDVNGVNFVASGSINGADANLSGGIGAGGDINTSGNMSAVNIDASGMLTSGDGSVQISDRRFKKDIETIQNALGNALKLRGVSYTWKDPKKSQSNQIGVIAQEVEEVYPEFVHTMDDGYKAVNYAQMTAVLIEAVKELNAKIEALESENTELKASLGKVESNDEQLKAMQSQIKSLQLMFEKLTEPGVQNVQVTGGQE